MWDAVGARTVTLDPGRHDLFVAWTSHLPHIASAALAHANPRAVDVQTCDTVSPRIFGERAIEWLHRQNDRLPGRLQ